MAQFKVTAIGYDAARHVDAIFSHKRLRTINPVNEGRLGNFRTFTYVLEIPDDEMIPKRRSLVADLGGNGQEYYAMYKCGDWMHVYLIKRFD